MIIHCWAYLNNQHSSKNMSWIIFLRFSFTFYLQCDNNFITGMVILWKQGRSLWKIYNIVFFSFPLENGPTSTAGRQVMNADFAASLREWKLFLELIFCQILYAQGWTTAWITALYSANTMFNICMHTNIYWLSSDSTGFLTYHV